MKRWLCLSLLWLLLLTGTGCATDGQPVPQLSHQINRQSSPPPPAVSQESLPGPDQNRTDTDPSESPDSSAEEQEASSISRSLQDSFQLVVTRDFGREELVNRAVPVKSGQDLLQYMKDELVITTGYGEGFINSIQDLASTYAQGQRWDWFFFVNGIASPVGAGQIKPVSGDMVWWDYHSWMAGPAQTAVIGCFPQPFSRYSSNGVKIRYERASLSQAAQVRDYLTSQGIPAVRLANVQDGASEPDHGEPVMVIGEWSALQGQCFLKQWNDAYRKNGAGVHFHDHSVDLLSADGSVQKTLSENAGVIVATGQGLGDTSPLWVVAGTDAEGIQAAADLLCSHPEKLKWKYGAAVYNGEVIPLPAGQ